MDKPIAFAAALALTVAAVIPAASAATGEVLTNDDVVTLIDAGLPPSGVVAKIAASETDFDTSVDQLVALAKAGVDASVLEAMAMAGGPTEPAVVRVGVSPAAAVKTNFQDTPCEVPGIFVEEGRALRDMDLTPATQIRSGFGLVSGLTFGLVPMQSQAAVHGARASTRTASGKPRFWFCFKVKPGVYRVTPEAALAPGEYAFYSPREAWFGPASVVAMGNPGSKLFAFGVDES